MRVEQKRKRRKIHTHLKFLAASNALPKPYFSQISKAQLSKYRNYFNHTDYLGNELAEVTAEEIDIQKLVHELKFTQKKLKKLLEILAFVKHFFISKKETLKLLQHDDFLAAIQKIQRYFPTKKITKFLKISPQVFSHRIKKSVYACSNSLLGLCFKKYVHQLTIKEIQTIKEFSTQEIFTYWKLRSIYFQGVRENLFHFSLATFYHYCSLLNIQKKSLKNYKQKIGLISYYPNQYWNADITFYKTMDGIKHGIYLVTDHFSKKIISWKIATKVCGKIRVETFEEALKNAQKSFENIDVKLIVDAGTENKNTTVTEFENEYKSRVQKIIHLSEHFRYSNSAIEAINKIIKNDYLNKMDIKNGDALEKAVEFVIKNYNNRPHGSHLGLNPDEVYSGLRPFWNTNFKAQRILRYQFNKIHCCKTIF